MNDSTTGIETPAGRCAALLRLLFAHGALRAGEFTLRSGRPGDYFVDFGAVHSAASSAALGTCYAAAIHHQLLAELAAREETLRAGRLPFALFGPAYKGISVAMSAALTLLSQYGCDADWAFNRKATKTHGEGGRLIGAPLSGRRVLLLDDVFTAGSAAREAIAQVRAAGGEVLGLLVGFDRQEPAVAGESGGDTAALRWQRELGLPLWALSSRADLLVWLRESAPAGEARDHLLTALSR